MPNEYMYEDKAALRNRAKQIRASLKNRAELSLRASERALPHIAFGNVLVYIPIGSELDIRPLITELFCRKNTVLYAPFTVNGDIIPRRLVRADGLIADPTGNLPLNFYADKPLDLFEHKIDCCITPFLAINERGYRLGYGKGCYDRFFASDRGMLKVGLGFCCQQLDFIEEQHDIPLDICVTERNVIYF